MVAGAASLIAILVATQAANGVAVGSPAHSPAAAPPRLTLTAGDMFALAKLANARGDEQTAAALYRALERDPNSDVRAEARFLQAMRLVRLNRARDAAILFRRLLDEKPGAAPARLQLAAMLQRLGHEEAALRELRALRSADLPPTVARFVDRLAATLQATKKYGFQIEVALAPDSNVNRATRADTLGTLFGDFTLTPESKAKSGIGVALRATAQARFPVNDAVHLVTRVSTDASLYRDKGFDEVTADVAGGPEARLGRMRLGLEAAIGQQWYAMKPYQRSIRVSGNNTLPLDRVSRLRVDAGLRWSDNRVNDLQDGRGLSLRAGYERALSPQMLVAASIGTDRYKAKDDAYSTRSWNAGLTAYREIGRMGLNAGFQLGRLQADDRLGILPEARKDRTTRLSFGAVFRQLAVAGFAPTTRLVVERNRSNIQIYDYKRTRTEIGVSRAF